MESNQRANNTLFKKPGDAGKSIAEAVDAVSIPKCDRKPTHLRLLENNFMAINVSNSENAQEAVNSANSGDTLFFEAGTYDPIVIDGKDSINIAAAPGDEGNVIFTTGTYDDSGSTGAGVRVRNSSNIDIKDIDATKSLWGIQVEESNDITLQNNEVYDVGQEAIHIKDNSSGVEILDNTIYDTGNRPKNAPGSGLPYSTFGEGIYLGTGSEGGDETNNITIKGNDISQTTGEAIDIKPYVSDVVVDGNLIHDINTGTQGAVVIGLQQGNREGGNFGNVDNIIFENNRLWNISDRTQFADGNAIRLRSGATINNNEIVNYDDRGIYVEVDEESIDNNFKIYHNTVYSAEGEGAQGDIVINNPDANVNLQNNIGYEGGSNIAASADLFANPSADPASNDLELKEGSPAIDAGVPTDVDVDIEGVSRDLGGAPDLGAYEYSDSAPAPAPAPAPVPVPVPADEEITGDSEDNTLSGSEGNDSLTGNAGDDTLNGNEGADTIDGNSGNDNLDGGYGNDVLIGGSGNDFIGDDTEQNITDNNGDDVLIGGVGSDTLAGGGGDDRLKGYSGDYREIDILRGDGGADEYVLASPENLYYDRSSASGEDRDYAIMQDFDSSDAIILNGSESDYSLSSGELGSQSSTDSTEEADTLIYFGSELIGVVEDSSGLSLSGSDFAFV